MPAAARPAAAGAPGAIAVAASGGRDSTALLHCVARQASPLGVRVVALHVHHGLMLQADRWLAQVRRQARAWGAGFASERLTGAPAPGDSVEAWARRGRYAALARMAHAAGCSAVLLAHHRDDQAETVLLQLLRGGGPRGLAAMPARAERDGLVWLRPWLRQPRAAIDAYRRRHRLAHADDASNDDPRFARSRLRAQVWPALAAAFPHAAAALAQAARHAHEAAALADETAAEDLRLVMAPDGALDVLAWLGRTPARRLNALRAWLRAALPQPVPETLVSRLDAELPHTAAARWPAGTVGLRLVRGRLRVDAPPPAPRPRAAEVMQGAAVEAPRRPSGAAPTPRACRPSDQGRPGEPAADATGHRQRTT